MKILLNRISQAPSHFLPSLLLMVLCSGANADAWAGPWEGDANGTRLVMRNEVVDDQLRGTIKDAAGYTYLIQVQVSGSTGTGTFTDPQTGAVLQSKLTLDTESLALSVFPPPPTDPSKTPLLKMVFVPLGKLRENAGTPPPAPALDPALVGTWIRSESSSDASSSFSFVVQWALVLKGDGSFVQTSQSAGGTLGVTGDNGPQLVAQGKWKTNDKVLWVDTGGGFQPFVRYLVDAQNMMFVFQDDTRQLWSRSY